MRIAALAMLLIVLGAAVAVVVRSPKGYAVQDREHIAEGPSSRHWAGTDDLGRDRGLRTAAAALIGLSGAVAAAALAASLAVGVGVAAAFSAPWPAKVVMYLCDLFLTLPWIFLLMVVRSALPLNMAPVHSAEVTFLLLAILGAPVFVRVNYARAVALRNAEWLIYGRAAGITTVSVARKYLLPHLRPIFLSQFLISIPVCLIAEANLGTLGLGISQPLPSWGSMLLELENPAALAGTHWLYLPITLLVVVLLLLELMVFEVEG